MEFVLELDSQPYVPLYRRVSDGLRKAILCGRLAPGEPMPSVRDLSSSLCVSRTTVLRAFEDLNSQGFCFSIKGAGTFVCKSLPGNCHFPNLPTAFSATNSFWQLRVDQLSDYGKRLYRQSANQRSLEADLINFGGAPIELVPLRPWKNLLLGYTRHNNLPLSFEADVFGYLPLRQALVEYLQRTRSVQCDSQEVVLFGSKQGRLDMIARVLVNPGDRVAFE
ncbi:MAG: GntR family transcriptional regulator, partial [Candidatus Obscuribacterales bacterium]|nr:GntR family transcriptional regulator [Candidatus Obscuribacterales bacterium]